MIHYLLLYPISVVRCLVRRYITEEQRKSQDFNITEDDINEVRQDIRSFRYELINILKMNDMKTPNMKSGDGVIGRKSKDLVRTTFLSFVCETDLRVHLHLLFQERMLYLKLNQQLLWPAKARLTDDAISYIVLESLERSESAYSFATRHFGNALAAVIRKVNDETSQTTFYINIDVAKNPKKELRKWLDLVTGQAAQDDSEVVAAEIVDGENAK